jgi:hypothetical protein
MVVQKSKHKSGGLAARELAAELPACCHTEQIANEGTIVPCAKQL